MGTASSAPAEPAAGHRFAFGDTGWHVWRDALLRTTGFPAEGLGRLAGPRCAAVADAYLDGSAAEEAFQAAFAETATQCSLELNRIAADSRLREAIIWQNPAIATLLDSLRRSGPPLPRNSKRRYRELQLTRFWQRYCAKTETIGFFGPTTWIEFSPATAGVQVTPGPRLLRRREVFIEPWVLLAYGAMLAEDPEIRRWLPPAPMPHFALRNGLLHRPGRHPVALSPAETAILSRCDGRRPAVTVVTHPETGLSAADGYRILADLERRQILRWDANLRLGPRACEQLRERIDAIGDDDTRQRATDGLRRLENRRAAVAAAAASPAALAEALANFDQEFTEITGKEPRRRQGQTYAGRGLCYEDTTRDLTVVIGRRLLDSIAAPMSIVLPAARWITSEIARVYCDALHKMYVEAQAQRPEPTLAELWDQMHAMLLGPGDLPVHEALGRLSARWASLFSMSAVTSGAHELRFSSAELLPRVPGLFPAERPGWSLARIHSPDLHICARSAQAVDDGDFLAVLGEMHLGYSTLHNWWSNWPLPDPARNLRLAIQDYGRHRFVPLMRTISSRDAGRTVQVEDSPTDHYIGIGRASGISADRVTPMGDVRICAVDGELYGVLPDDARHPLLEFFAHHLSATTVNAFRHVAADPHTPRITVDQMTLFRETWRTDVRSLSDLLVIRGEAGQYLAARRLVAAMGLPDLCFVKMANEAKPVYVDFTSPMYVGSLCVMLRAARDATGEDTPVTISEMLPTPDQAWIPDSLGRTYFGEIRMQLTDPAVAWTVAGRG